MTPPLRIYLASSWRNASQPAVVRTLRDLGSEVYDFRAPVPGNEGFHWSEIDPAWETWTAREYVEALEDPIAVRGFGLDMAALGGCDACVLVLPCGRSAHLELGWAVGHGKRSAVYIVQPSTEPELMYRMVDHVVTDLRDLIDVVQQWQAHKQLVGSMAL